jgi:DNA-binding IclR family transcriptional regulator
MSQREEKLVGALVGGLKVIRYLNRMAEPIGVNQAARDLELAPSTAYNLLRTLVHERVAVFNPESKTYTAGPGLAELAGHNMAQADYLEMVRTHMRVLAKDHGINMLLWHRNEDHAVLIDVAQSPTSVRVQMDVGQRLPLYIAAFGRCLAADAGMAKDELRVHFEAMRWHNAPDFEAYYRDVKAAAELGYAVDRDNFSRGATTVAALIFDETDNPVMAISGVDFSVALEDERLQRIAEAIRDRAEGLSFSMGATRALRGHA